MGTQTPLEAVMNLMFGIAPFGGLVAVFFAVDCCVGAQGREQRSHLRIEFILGWTLIGWVIAMMWAKNVDDHV